MIIAINTRILSGNNEIAFFLVECFAKIAALNPAHHFIFISEKTLPQEIPAAQNIQQIVIDQNSSNPLLWKLWYNYKLPAVVKKYKAGILINAGGIYSVRTKIPQCLFVNDLSFLQHPSWYPKKYVRFAKANIAGYLNKAKLIIATSNFLKEEIIRQYKTAEKKIQVIYPPANKTYESIAWNEKELIKKKYTGGKEYFLFNGIVHPQNNLINLLKAFSFFKKRQKSNMQLIIAVPHILPDDAFMQSLRLYKYRQEVNLLPGLPENELQKVFAAAYAFARPSIDENNFDTAIHAMQCEVPVVCGNGVAAMETCGDAALYVNTGNFEDIADKMMLLFKDENKRNVLIEKGLVQSAKYTAGETAAQLFKIILTTIEPV